MFVRSPDHQYLFPLQTKVAGINIGRYIHPGQMSDMYRSVRIRQRRSYQRSLKMFFHTLCSLFEGQRYGIIRLVETDSFPLYRITPLFVHQFEIINPQRAPFSAGKIITIFAGGGNQYQIFWRTVGIPVSQWKLDFLIGG